MTANTGELSESRQHLTNSSNERYDIEKAKSKSSTLNSIGSEANLALQYFDKHVDFTKDEEEAVRRKIDIRTMPLLAITYGLQYVDKVSLSYAANYGLREQLHLVGNQYNWVGSIFYVSFLIFEWLVVALMQKFRLSKYLAVSVFLWGGVLMCHGSAQSFVGLMICRIFLGIFEASIVPGCNIITGRFYRKQEIPFRTSFWASFVGIGQFVGGLITYGIGNIKGSLPSWKYVFIILGAITCIWAVFLYFFLPSSPTDANFLNERERSVAIARVSENKHGVSLESKIHWYQIKDGLTDPQIIIIFFLSILIAMPNGGITNFLSLVINGLGFSPVQTVLHQLPVGAIMFILIIAGGLIISRISNCRIIASICSILPCLICSTLLWKLPRSNTTGLLVSTYFINSFGITVLSIFSLLNANVAGTTKRGFGFAMHCIGFSVGNIAGPFMFKTEQAPQYIDGCVMMVICFALSIVFLCLLRFYYQYENFCRRKHLTDNGIDPALHKTESEKLGFLDKTDRENPFFVYSL